MTPSAVSVTPPPGVKTSELTAAAVAQKMGAVPSLQRLDASRLEFTKTSRPMTVPVPGDPVGDATIAAASQCTDHMIWAVWNASTGWAAPKLLPPDANCRRMLLSATRIALPAFDPRELEKLIVAMVAIDGRKWLPKCRPGTCLYVRPTMIGSAGALGVATPTEATLFVIATFMPSLSQSKGLKLLASHNGVRAWPGGFGYAKVGANYGPSLMASGEARARGYDQVLWLLDGLVTEAGASNFFVVWKSREGKIELVTAPLGDKVILDGITRRSILQLANERLTDGKSGLAPIEINERQFTMEDIVDAVDEGRIIEAFAAGTAYFVSPVSVINYRARDLEIPMSRGDSGDYAAILKSWLEGIMYGKEDHEWGVVVEEKEKF